MKVRGLLIVSMLLAAVMAIAGGYAAALLAPGTQLPVHWNELGEVNGTAPALVALLLPAAMVFGCALLFALIPLIEPLQDRLDGSAPVLRTVWIGILALGPAIEVAVGAPGFGWTLPIFLPGLAAGAMLVMIGNVLPKSRPGFFVGIRTPWAIMDTDNWIATHRLGGKLMVVAGMVLIVAAVVPLGHARDLVVPAALFAAVVPPVVYSWWLWQRRPRTAGEVMPGGEVTPGGS